jgi:hypothetical protein
MGTGGGGEPGGDLGDGEIFFQDDFEGGAVGESPPNWDFVVGYDPNLTNPNDTTRAVIDATRAVSGNNSVHVVGGGNGPVLIVRPLPEGTNRVFVRANFYLTKKLGNNAEGNHETLMGLRGDPTMAAPEVRFGEIKGAVGTNVDPRDQVSPPVEQWNAGPEIPAGQWVCIEVGFLGDIAAYNELHAWVDGEEIHSVTKPEDWHVADIPANWMEGMFAATILGWHSHSQVNTELWIDDVVASTERIGCP